MKTNAPTPQVRLQAKKRLLEQQSMKHQLRLKNNLSYASTHIPTVIGAQVAQSSIGRSPFVSFITRKILPAAPARTKVMRFNSSQPKYTGRSKSPLSVDKLLSVASLVLPIFFGFARKKAFIFGLKGLRGLLKLGGKRLFAKN